MLDIPEGEALVHATSATYVHKPTHVPGQLLIFKETVAFHTRVFGVQINKAQAARRKLRATRCH